MTNLAVDQIKKVQSEKLKKNAAEWIIKLRAAENRIIPLSVPIELKQSLRLAIERNKEAENTLRTKIPELSTFLDRSIQEAQDSSLGFVFVPWLIWGAVVALSAGGIYTANKLINLKRAELESAENQIQIYQNTYDVVYEQTGDATKAQEMAWKAVSAATNESIIKTLDAKISENRKKMLYVVGGVGLVFLISRAIK